MNRTGGLASQFVRKLVFTVKRLAREQPFRLLTKSLILVAPVSFRRKSRWDVVARPPYLVGLFQAADQAISEKVPAISAIEFGVAEGRGLLLLEEYADAVERETGVRIEVYGFDTGKGLPELCGDYRDHPDFYEPGKYSMKDESALRQRLSPRAKLVVGDVAQTVPQFVRNSRHAPVGFIACDLGLYSSTRDALQVLSLPEKRMLKRVPMYFSCTDGFEMHQFAGERLAIAEFNSRNHHVRIDQWRGISFWRAFPEARWIQGMHVAHDLEAISKAQ